MGREKTIKKIIISTMPRSGTVFFFDFMARLFNFEKLEPKFTCGFKVIPPEWDPYKCDKTYLELKENQVICAHYPLNQEIHDIISHDNVLAIYLYRDPRDAAVSAALYLKYALTHFFLNSVFSRLSESEAIALMLSGLTVNVKELPENTYKWNKEMGNFIHYGGIKYYCDFAYSWLNHPNVAKIRYEDFTLEPVNSLLHSLELVNVKISKNLLKNITGKYNFQTVTGGRSKGKEDKHSHYRKGIIGDYKNYFNEFHRCLCKYNIGDDLIKMGYENGFDW
jgi:sulfotransferase 6B1